MARWKQLFKLAGAAVTSDLVLKGFTLLGLLMTGGAALALPSWREALVGFSAAMLVTLVTSIATRYAENRDENSLILSRTDKMHIAEHGTVVVYECSVQIRAKSPNLRSWDIRFSWTGETNIATAWEPIGDWNIVNASPTRAFTNFTFEFDPPLRRREKRAVGIRFRMIEPKRQYSTMITLDPRAFAWGVLAQRKAIVTWDKSNPVETDSIYARTYRSGWDRHRESAAAKDEWGPRHLKVIENDGHYGRRWTIWPMRLDRWYILQFKLHPPVDFDSVRPPAVRRDHGVPRMPLQPEDRMDAQEAEGAR